jgi:SWI/SNF-related matrix-associated actin-dependent regulator of chromatin subfamily A3
LMSLAFAEKEGGGRKKKAGAGVQDLMRLLGQEGTQAVKS